jgi:hypothetical protein
MVILERIVIVYIYTPYRLEGVLEFPPGTWFKESYITPLSGSKARSDGG